MGRFVFAIIVLSILVAFVAPVPHPPRAPGTVIAVSSTGAAVSDLVTTTTNGPPADEMSLDRDPSGHFATTASVNGERLPFVVDTGADVVALTIDDARRVGLYVDPTSFTVIAQGASGPVRGEEVVLDRVVVAGRTVEHVRGAVLEGLGQNLLGQSVLTKLGGVEMKGDKMVLR